MSEFVYVVQWKNKNGGYIMEDYPPMHDTRPAALAASESPLYANCVTRIARIPRAAFTQLDALCTLPSEAV